MSDEEKKKLELPMEMSLDTCCQCGIRFGMPTYYETQRKKDHKLFCCPNGHQQYFGGVNDRDIMLKYKAVLEKIATLEVGVILNKHSLELAIALAKNALQ